MTEGANSVVRHTITVALVSDNISGGIKIQAETLRRRSLERVSLRVLERAYPLRTHPRNDAG